jgi:hypothetical protein
VIREDHRSNTVVSIFLNASTSRTDHKRIAQAIIHFEPVFDLLMPDQHESELFIRRNWRDHPRLANFNQAESIALIEEISAEMPVGNTLPGGRWVGPLLWPDSERGVLSNYSWNLSRNLEIQFGRLPASATAGDSVRWANFTLSFVQNAIACSSPAQLQKIASNRLGLQYFLTRKLRNIRTRLIKGISWHVDIQSNQPIVHS